MFNKLFTCCLFSSALLYSITGWSADECDPLVPPFATEAAISQQLSFLAEKYNFSLSFPKSMDRSMSIEESMELSQLVKLLTSGMNTILSHETIGVCKSPRLTDLTVISPGEESDFITVKKNNRAQPLSYIYIDDMEAYVTEVLLHKRKAEKSKMTPQQLAEYKLIRKRLKKDLKSEIAEVKKEKDRSGNDNHKRNKKRSGDI